MSASIDFVPESSYVREEARLITEAPLTIMPPPSYATSDGTSLRTTTRSKAPFGGTKEKKVVPIRPTTGALGLKQKAPEDSCNTLKIFILKIGLKWFIYEFCAHEM